MSESNKKESRLNRQAKIVVAIIITGAGLFKISQNPKDWINILIFMLVAIIISVVISEFVNMEGSRFMKILAKIFGIFIMSIIMIATFSLVSGQPKVFNENVSKIIGIDIKKELFIDVICVDHVGAQDGQYFNFDATQVDDYIGNDNWKEARFAVKIARDNYEKEDIIVVWRSKSRGATCVHTAHGRLNVNQRKNDFKKNDKIQIIKQVY